LALTLFLTPGSQRGLPPCQFFARSPALLPQYSAANQRCTFPFLPCRGPQKFVPKQPFSVPPAIFPFHVSACGRIPVSSPPRGVSLFLVAIVFRSTRLVLRPCLLAPTLFSRQCVFTWCGCYLPYAGTIFAYFKAGGSPP